MISPLIVAQALNASSPTNAGTESLNGTLSQQHQLNSRSSSAMVVLKQSMSWIGNSISVVSPEQVDPAGRGDRLAMLGQLDEFRGRLPARWKFDRDETNARPTMKEVLLGDGWRGSIDLPRRGEMEWRPLPDFSGN